MTDPIHGLAHDHGELERRVRVVASMLAELERAGREDIPASLATVLGELRELLFLHFAREEEGLFPFVVEVIPELGAPVHEMMVAHDTICGALARAVELAYGKAALSAIATIYRRFESAHAEHARLEATVLSTADARLDGAQRARLASLVRGL